MESNIINKYYRSNYYSLKLSIVKKVDFKMKNHKLFDIDREEKYVFVFFFLVKPLRRLNIHDYDKCIIIIFIFIIAKMGLSWFKNKLILMVPRKFICLFSSRNSIFQM